MKPNQANPTNYAFIDDESIDQYILKDLGNGNRINYSSIRNIGRSFTPRAFAVKYVIEGSETYIVNSKKFTVKAGEYLLVNPSHSCEVIINSEKAVKGLCIDVSADLLADVSKTLLQPQLLDCDEMKNYMLSPRFFENNYKAESNASGALLMSSGKVLDADHSAIKEISDDFYFHLARNLVTEQLSIAGKLNSIKTVKTETRKELLRRMLIGKEFIDDSYCEKIDIASIAKTAALSEYHFFRLFKTVFHISPHQYILEKRLAKVAEHIINGGHSLSDLALRYGFADISSLSRSFKKKYGVAPSSFSRI